MAAEQEKIAYTEILRDAGAEKFAEILSASSRKAREAYFHRHGVRSATRASRLPKPGAKNEIRTAKLFEIIKGTDDDEMAEEILRTWLLTKREMLAAALDHLGIEHEQGLTDSDDIEKFEQLGKKEVQALADAAAAHGQPEDVRVYLKYMGVKDVDKKLG